MVRIIGKVGMFIVMGIGLAWAVLFAGYYINVELNKHKAEREIRHYLQAVQQQDYNKAVRLFGEPLDGDRLQQLQPFRLVKYSQVKADFDDGCVCSGRAKLTFQTDGLPVTVDAVIALRAEYKPGQICAGATKAQHSALPALAEWNKVNCGSSFL
ncbi:hypothetical protein [Paenibacillus glycanilyticus]|uniref:Uncharacterized protein n=1 Tax=Paenibacillus glycanilyticus TaxID=126569 RepID=A0ABQ6GEK3_9BACL|nr:hypothetical protein [Paenibacillus glycanilyticus]GLX68675.1 hypothetical protein MU1_30200 [Paenibacillus glycanilyticus]